MNMNFRTPSWAELKKHRTSLLAVLLTLLTVLIVHLAWLSSVVAEKDSIQDQIHQQEDMITKYRKKLEQAQSIKEKMLQQENELKQMQTRLFQGKDPYQLAASLGDLLATKEGPKLDIKTYQVLASKEFGLYQQVDIRFNFMTNIEGLFYFLDRIKNFQASILIQEINIQSIKRKTGPDLVINVILAALLEKA